MSSDDNWQPSSSHQLRLLWVASSFFVIFRFSITKASVVIVLLFALSRSILRIQVNAAREGNVCWTIVVWFVCVCSLLAMPFLLIDSAIKCIRLILAIGKKKFKDGKYFATLIGWQINRFLRVLRAKFYCLLAKAPLYDLPHCLDPNYLHTNIARSDIINSKSLHGEHVLIELVYQGCQCTF